MTAAAHAALLRGVNVGRAKRVAMAELRRVAEELGYGSVRTLLNSGNLVLTAGEPAAAVAARLEEALLGRFGVASRVTVLTAGELATVMAENPLAAAGAEPARLLVAVWREPGDRLALDALHALAGQDWGTERLAVGTRAAYVWCPEGIATSRLPEALDRALRDRVTTRNWATMTKLHALVREVEARPA